MTEEFSSETRLAFLESLFVRYGAVPTDLDRENREKFGLRTVYSRKGNYYRTGTAEFDSIPFLLLSVTDNVRYADLGILEDVDALPLDADDVRLEKAVRYAFGIEPYPDKYPE